MSRECNCQSNGRSSSSASFFVGLIIGGVIAAIIAIIIYQKKDKEVIRRLRKKMAQTVENFLKTSKVENKTIASKKYPIIKKIGKKPPKRFISR